MILLKIKASTCAIVFEKHIPFVYVICKQNTMDYVSHVIVNTRYVFVCTMKSDKNLHLFLPEK